MKPPARPKMEYEKVVVGEMISGSIEVVEYDMQHKFKGFQGKEDTVQPAVRLKFKLDGYQHPKFTRWMKFTLSEKSNLWKKYVSKLVADVEPDCDIDLDILNGMKIKTVWSEENDFQNLDSIYPIGPKVASNSPVSPKEGTFEADHEEDIPNPDEPF